MLQDMEGLQGRYAASLKSNSQLAFYCLNKGTCLIADVYKLESALNIEPWAHWHGGLITLPFYHLLTNAAAKGPVQLKGITVFPNAPVVQH